MLFRDQRQRMSPRSESRRRPKKKRDIRHMLRQGQRLRLISWDEAKPKKDTEIAMIADTAKKRVKFEARAKKNGNTVNRAAVEASDKKVLVPKSREKIERKREMRQGKIFRLR